MKQRKSFSYWVTETFLIDRFLLRLDRDRRRERNSHFLRNSSVRLHEPLDPTSEEELLLARRNHGTVGTGVRLLWTANFS